MLENVWYPCSIAAEKLGIRDLIGEDGVGLWTIDKEILSLGEAVHAGDAGED